MEALLGITGLFAGLLLTIILILQYPYLRLVLLFGYTARAIAALVHAYVIPLPDGTGDAIQFELVAANFSEHGLEAAFFNFPGYSSGWGYSWIVSMVYSISDRSTLLMQSFSVIAGVGSVYLTYQLSRTIWHETAALRSAWVVALFPTLIMYSALPMREAFIVFFALFGFLNIERWHQFQSIGFLFLGFLGFLAAGFFHGAMLLGALIYAAYLAGKNLAKTFRLFSKGYISLYTLVPSSIGLSLVISYLAGFFEIPYIGDISRMISIEAYISQGVFTQTGEASYPYWLTPKDPLHYLAMLPLRLIYFIGAPFPWDIQAARHLVGFFDGILYFAFVWLVIRNFSTIWANPRTRVVMIVIISLLAAYAVGTGNFGTGLRHRAKFIAMIVILSAPFLPNISWRFKHKKSST